MSTATRSTRPTLPPVRTDLRGHVALVTGASRGIGRGIAVRLGASGATVVVNYSRDAAGAAATVAAVEATGSTALAMQADVSRRSAVVALFRTVRERHGRVDVVVVNAGVDAVGGPFAEVDEEAYERLVAVNARGAFWTLQQAAAAISDGGSIVTIGSSAALRPVPGFGLYGSSKVPTTYLAGVLSQELAGRRITVNTVIPTATEGAGYFAATDDPDDPVRAAARAGAAGGRLGTIEDVADAVEFFVGPLARWTSGQQLLVAGGAPS